MYVCVCKQEYIIYQGRVLTGAVLQSLGEFMTFIVYLQRSGTPPRVVALYYIELDTLP